ncbi:MAG: adenosine deaminase [Actinobacteria bacterium]|nr:adenosine deaminase [Actinomycetota bacterium]
MGIDADVLVAMPKVALHDHLDGGLRAGTVWELATEIGHELPVGDADSLAQWFFEAADSGSLVRYLETFDHTIAVMQTYPQLKRVAQEWVEDLAADGVVYGEARWAPEQHLRSGLSMALAIEAVRDGLAEGMAAAAAAGRPIVARQLVTSMRHATPTPDVAELAVAYRHDSVYSSLRSSAPSLPSEELKQAWLFAQAASVAGFDIAGAEDGFPPSRFAAVFEYLRRHNVQFTIHAGEAFGPASIWEAVQLCGASRIGHGVRLVEDITGGPGEWVLGDLANYVLDRRIALEICPSSNLQTGIADTVAEHPFGLLAELGFRVTVSCDNRLMSRTTLSREFGLLADAFGYDLTDLRRFTLNAARSAFHPYRQREALIRDVILPGFAALGLPTDAPW